MAKTVETVVIRSIHFNPTGSILLVWDILDTEGDVLGSHQATVDELNFPDNAVQALIDRVNNVASTVLQRRYS